jgi:hypothetical protein
LISSQSIGLQGLCRIARQEQMLLNQCFNPSEPLELMTLYVIVPAT